MLKIRLQRVGRKHEPGFRLVLTDSKNSTRSGRVAEVLGSYDPRKTSELLHTERISHWLSKGAGLTASVNNLLIKKGIIRGKKIHVSTDLTPQPTTDNSQPVEVKETGPEASPAPEASEAIEANEASVEETPQEPAPEV